MEMKLPEGAARIDFDAIGEFEYCHICSRFLKSVRGLYLRGAEVLRETDIVT